MLPLCRFYRYLIYRLYHFRDDTPTINTIGVLMIVHWGQFISIVTIIEEITSIHFWPDLPFYSERYKLIPGFLIWMIIHFILFYDRKKWKSYEEEFRDETPKQRRKGLILVLAYLIGSTIMFFALFGILMIADDMGK